MTEMAQWTRGRHEAGGRGHDTYRRGSGPGVVVIHEVPGITPELGGPGVGAVGMCFTGGFALAMMVDPAVVASVLAQPSLPFAIGRRRAADLGVGADDRAAISARVRAGCPVLGVQYAGDGATGTRFDTLDAELGDGFIRVDLEGKGHATLTAHRQQRAVDRVLDFLDERLRA